MTLLAVLSTAKELVAFMLWRVTRGRKYAVPPIVLQDNGASFVLENLEDTVSRTNILIISSLLDQLDVCMLLVGKTNYHLFTRYCTDYQFMQACMYQDLKDVLNYNVDSKHCVFGTKM